METARDYSVLLSGGKGSNTDNGPILKELDFLK